MYLSVLVVVALGFLSSQSSLATSVPQKIALTSRSWPGRRRDIAPSTIPLADFFLGTDLQYVMFLHLFPPVLILISTNLGGSETFQVSNMTSPLPLANIFLGVISWDPPSGTDCQDFLIYSGLSHPDFGN